MPFGLIIASSLMVNCPSSVLGTVTSLSGKPEEGISLEARSVSRGYYEETITDSEGKYRLRGLLPNTEYTIKAILKVDKPGLPKIERASPSSVSIEVNISQMLLWMLNDQYIQNINFQQVKCLQMDTTKTLTSCS